MNILLFVTLNNFLSLTENEPLPSINRALNDSPLCLAFIVIILCSCITFICLSMVTFCHLVLLICADVALCVVFLFFCVDFDFVLNLYHIVVLCISVVLLMVALCMYRGHFSCFRYICVYLTSLASLSSNIVCHFVLMWSCSVSLRLFCVLVVTVCGHFQFMIVLGNFVYILFCLCGCLASLVITGCLFVSFYCCPVFCSAVVVVILNFILFYISLKLLYVTIGYFGFPLVANSFCKENTGLTMALTSPLYCSSCFTSPYVLLCHTITFYQHNSVLAAMKTQFGWYRRAWCCRGSEFGDTLNGLSFC